MKRIIVMVVAATAIMLSGIGAAYAASADKPPSPPGQGECAHGNSNKPCKDDPQPEHGKDCDEHGPKNGGVNEDHCKGGDETVTEPTTPTETQPTTPTETQPTTPEETIPCSDCPMPTVPSDVTEPGTTTTSETPGTAPTPQPVTPPVTPTVLEKQLDKQATDNGASNAPGRPQAADELPYTGLPLGFWIALGLGFVASGLALRRWSRR